MQASTDDDMPQAENGIVSLDFPTWSSVVFFVDSNSFEFGRFVWRGQRCDNWPLLPTLYRTVQNTDPKITRVIELHHLDAFRSATRGRLASADRHALANFENHWWALGQHYDLETPLLDWTRSPFAAAYFAFVGDGHEQTDSRVVYGLNRSVIEALRISPAESIAFHEPIFDANPRLVSQGGLFTRAPTGVRVEEWVKNQFSGSTAWVLFRLTIPDSQRDSALRGLTRMNINHATLYPDLHGASGYCNTRLRISDY
jgi:hypothetical protein